MAKQDKNDIAAIKRIAARLESRGLIDEYIATPDEIQRALKARNAHSSLLASIDLLVDLEG